MTTVYDVVYPDNESYDTQSLEFFFMKSSWGGSQVSKLAWFWDQMFWRMEVKCIHRLGAGQWKGKSLWVCMQKSSLKSVSLFKVIQWIFWQRMQLWLKLAAEELAYNMAIFLLLLNLPLWILRDPKYPLSVVQLHGEGGKRNESCPWKCNLLCTFGSNTWLQRILTIPRSSSALMELCTTLIWWTLRRGGSNVSCTPIQTWPCNLTSRLATLETHTTAGSITSCIDSGLLTQ